MSLRALRCVILSEAKNLVVPLRAGFAKQSHEIAASLALLAMTTLFCLLTQHGSASTVVDLHRVGS